MVKYTIDSEDPGEVLKSAQDNNNKSIDSLFRFFDADRDMPELRRLLLIGQLLKDEERDRYPSVRGIRYEK